MRSARMKKVHDGDSHALPWRSVMRALPHSGQYFCRILFQFGISYLMSGFAECRNNGWPGAAEDAAAHAGPDPSGVAPLVVDDFVFGHVVRADLAREDLGVGEERAALSAPAAPGRPVVGVEPLAAAAALVENKRFLHDGEILICKSPGPTPSIYAYTVECKQICGDKTGDKIYYRYGISTTGTHVAAYARGRDKNDADKQAGTAARRAF